MVTKILLSVALISTFASAIDYSKAVDSVKMPEAISTVSKGTSMTMGDVSNSVDTEKLTAAVLDSNDTAKVKEEVTEVKNKVTKIEEKAK